jgi:hypothetical protein
MHAQCYSYVFLGGKEDLFSFPQKSGGRLLMERDREDFKPGGAIDKKMGAKPGLKV